MTINQKMYYILFAILLFTFSKSKAQITIGNTSLDTSTLANHLNTPWDLIYTPDSSLFFTERIGKVSRIDLINNQTHLLIDISPKVEAIGESGLLGMAINLNMALPRIYLVYTYKDSNNTFFEKVESYIYDSNQDTLLFDNKLIDSIPANTYHTGARLVLHNNQLYISTGDAGNTSLSQDLNSLAGKILRINLNGSIPNDNPINGSPIYSWGHRNPQGLYFANNFMYSSEHGPTTDDEINIITKGENYGWPNVHGFCDLANEITFCNDSNVTEPIYAWTPTVATAGISYYEHSAIPEWNESILLATLKDSRLISLKLNSAKDSIVTHSEYLINTFGRLRDVETNSWGEVFIATNSTPHRIIKLHNANFTSINEINSHKYEVKYWPNPANEKLKIKSSNSKINNIQLYNIDGKEVLNKTTATKNLELNTSVFNSGLYILKITFDDKIQIINKVVIDHY